MSDTDPTAAPPRLPDAYVASHDQATDEAAYQEEMARLASTPQAAPTPSAGEPPSQGQTASPQAEEGSAPPARVAQADGASPSVAQAEGPTEDMIGAEMQRLAEPPFEKSRYANPEEALRQRALQNLGGQAAPETFGQKALGAAEDIGYGATFEAPAAIYSGVHGAVRSVFQMADELDDWTAKKFNDWGLSALNAAIGHQEGAGLFHGWTALSGTEADALKAQGKAQEASSAGGFDEVTPFSHIQLHTETGIVIKNAAQFLTGMAFAGGQLRALGLPTNLAGWAGRGVTAARGFLAQFEAFDGAQHRLSDLVQSVPALRNPVTAFLASKPDDNAAEKRVKDALEGSILGEGADGILSGLKMLRGAQAARGAAQNLIAHEAARPPPAPSAGLQALGEPAAPGAPVTVDLERFGASATEQAKMAAAEGQAARANVAPEELASAGKATKEEGSDVKGPIRDSAIDEYGEQQRKAPEAQSLYINFARIDGPQDLKNTMQTLADKFGGDIDLARRGVRTFQETQLGAQAEDAWTTLMDRRVGEPLNDTQSLAARQLWASSAAKTMQLADIAVKAPTPENLFAFRRMLVTHAAVQEQVIAARTETARALSSWRIPAGDDPRRLQGIMQRLSGDAGMKGGLETAQELAQKVHDLAGAQDFQGLSALSEKSALARTRDAVLEGWTNGLLTSPLTHVKVAASNVATLALRVGERAVASRLDALTGNTGVAPGEAPAQVAGLLGGLNDAFRFAGKVARSAVSGERAALGNDPLSNAVKAARTGRYSLDESANSEYLQNAGAISSQALGMASTGWVGHAVDLLGQIARSPGRALTAEHDFFRSIGYRMSLNALATREAVADVHAGRIPASGLGDRVSELIAHPPPQLHYGAVDDTLYQTFTDAPGKLAQTIGALRNDYPLLRVILPFYRIPSRILSFTFERTPLAPLMQTFRANIAAGGARRSLALTQMGLGTAAMLATGNAVLNGQVTGSGPVDPTARAALENEGWQPYSVRVGNRWWQYNRLEPVGSAMGMGADAVEAMRNFHSQVNGDDPDTSNLALATVAAMANDVTSKSYLQGLANFFEAIADPKSSGKHALASLAGSIVPAGLASIDRVTDPYKREVYRMIDAIRARTPGLSEGLPPARNLWGEPIANASGEGKAFDLLSPIGTRPAGNEPIDGELLRQGIDLSRVPSRSSFNGVTLDLNRIDPKIYSRYQELAGNAWKGPDGLGLKDALNALVTGQHPYSPLYQRYGAGGDGPDGPKADMIRDIVNQYREGARQQLLHEYPQLLDAVRQGQAARQALRTGAP